MDQESSKRLRFVQDQRGVDKNWRSVGKSVTSDRRKNYTIAVVRGQISGLSKGTASLMSRFGNCTEYSGTN